MYTQDFYITEAVGNNAFSFLERKNKKLFIPKLKEIKSFDEIHLLDSDSEKITFEEYDFDGSMQKCYGLENLYEYNSLLNPLTFQGKGATKPKIYLVDNHNHVFYFWYLARQQGIISDGVLLYHIDEHADTRDPGKYLLKPDSEDLQKVFEYTNFFLNVGNYIIPAEKEGLIGETIQIRSEEALKKYFKTPLSGIFSPARGKGLQNTSHLSRQETSEKQSEATISKLKQCRIERGVVGKQSVILNLDLDFFEPELDFIDYDLKKQVILDLAQKADLITVCTSPYFINQKRALEVFKDLFGT